MVEKEKSKQGTLSENVEIGVTSPPSPPFRHVKWKRARIKKSGAPSFEQSGLSSNKLYVIFSFFFIYFKALIISMLENMIFVYSCRIPWNPTVNLLLKVVTISWLKQLDDLSTLVVFVQLDKGSELNYILEFQNDSHPPPPKRTKLKCRLRYVKK